MLHTSFLNLKMVTVICNQSGFVQETAGVYVFSSKWSDLIVAIFMAYLSVTASYKVLLVVKDELKEAMALQKV